MDKLYLLIAGGRDFNDYETAKICLNKEIEKLPKLPIVVISGTAHGADSIGEQWAEENNYEIIRYKPEWDRFGPKAGPLRNIEMYNFIKDKKEKKVITFWDGKSTGTKHMIRTSLSGELPISIYKYNGELM